jgi:hypothetical protein
MRTALRSEQSAESEPMSSSPLDPWSTVGLWLMLRPRGRALLIGLAVTIGAAAIVIIALVPTIVALVAGPVAAMLWCRSLPADLLQPMSDSYGHESACPSVRADITDLKKALESH